jgi:lactate racemase
LLATRPSPRELLHMITSPGFARPDQWQVQIQAQIQLKAKVLVKAGGLSERQIRAAQFEPIEDVGSAVRQAMRVAGPMATLCVLPQGPQTVPYLR